MLELLKLFDLKWEAPKVTAHIHIRKKFHVCSKEFLVYFFFIGNIDIFLKTVNINQKFILFS